MSGQSGLDEHRSLSSLEPNTHEDVFSLHAAQ